MPKRLAVVLLALLALAGCRKPETPKPAAPAQPHVAASGPVDGGRLTRRLESDLGTLNYVLQTLDEERQVFAYLYDPLIDLDQNLNPHPATAASWDIQDGGKTYVLHLDPRATFSDGTPVLASDVVFTLGKILDAESMQFASWFEGLDRSATRALDDHTVRVVFKQARVTQLLSFNIGVLPEHVYGKGDFAKIQRVVGNGAYTLTRRTPGQSVLLTRRKDYWRARPPIASVLFRVIHDDAVAWRAVLRGDLDVSRISNDTWFRVKDDPAVTQKLAFVDAWLLSYNAIAWNLDDPLFTDANVRRALAMSYDRQRVITELYHGQARPLTGPFTPDQWANDPDVTPVPFNLTAAAALLGSAGWRDTNGDGTLDRNGHPFAFKLLVPSGSSSSRAESQVLQDALAHIGVKVEITPLDDAAFFDQILKRNYQAALLGWSNDPDPDPYSLFHSSQIPPAGLNVVGYRNPEADALIEQGRVEFDHARRVELYHQLHDILARDQPYLWTVQWASKWAVNKRVQNVKTANGLGLFLWYPAAQGWWLQ
ncbi:MAG: hypothetical protein JO197_20625 [Acidobacteria bacterium]|nr:hypothetical protein [Acidobacteriota bacterium]MBV9474494.1 hypothetical protein [Acidobacteriota bacterium]